MKFLQNKSKNKRLRIPAQAVFVAHYISFILLVIGMLIFVVLWYFGRIQGP